MKHFIITILLVNFSLTVFSQNNVAIQAFDAQVNTGNEIMYPITINPNGNSVGSFSFEIEYDSNLLQILNLTGANGWSVFSNPNTPGIIKVAGYKIGGQNTSFQAANLKVKAIGQAGQTSQIKLKIEIVADLNLQTLNYQYSNGNILITGIISTCNDNIQNGDETDVDCGGSCSSCCNYTQAILNGNLSTNYSAENYIISPPENGSAVVQANKNVTMKAGEYIKLLPGFTAKYGCDFLAIIDDCNNASAPKIGSLTNALTLRNFPNPFSGKTTIEFELPNDSKATLFVTDMIGKKVATLLDNEAQAKGYHTVNFDGSNYPPGMYYYTLQAGDYVETQKMILMK